jgi:hypothetical protein
MSNGTTAFIITADIMGPAYWDGTAFTTYRLFAKRFRSRGAVYIEIAGMRESVDRNDLRIKRLRQKAAR